MKKPFCILLSFMLLLSLTACQRQPLVQSGTSTTTDVNCSTGIDETINDTLRMPLIAISTPVNRESTRMNDETEIFFLTYQDIAMIAPDAEHAEKITLKLLQKIDERLTESKVIQDYAKQDYLSGNGYFPYFYKNIYNPVRIDEKVLSLYGAETVYSGGVHPNLLCVSANYDMATGEELELKDILQSDAAAASICGTILTNLKENEEEYMLFDGYDDAVQQQYGSLNTITTDSWYLSAEGLSLYFSPYELAPYASGIIEVMIPYDQLNGILKDDFLPPELPGCNGKADVILAQDIDLNKFSQFAEAILDPNGERFLFFSDGLISNIRLLEGTWDENGVRFTPTHTAFLANTLGTGDAIMVQAMFSDVMPNLQLSYDSGDQTYTYFVAQSGKDGSIYLIEPEETH